MTARAGFALVYALFMVMALSLVGLALMVAGSTEAIIATEVTRQAAARTRAEAAALAVVEGWSTRELDFLTVGESTPRHVDGVGEATAVVTRLDSVLYLVSAESLDPDAAAVGRAVTARAGLLARTLDPDAMETAFPAAITATDSVHVQEAEASGIDPCGPPVPAIHAPIAVTEAGSVVTGNPPVLRDVPDPPPAPDPFGTELAPTLATLTYGTGTIVPRPLADAGGCITDDRNWGALDPGHACYPLRPLIHGTGTLAMTGGVGRGALVVDGDVRLTNGARFAGILVVRGRLIIEDGSRVRGAVRARTVVVRNGQVLRDRCILQEILSAPILDRAFRPAGRWWVPVF